MKSIALSFQGKYKIRTLNPTDVLRVGEAAGQTQAAIGGVKWDPEKDTLEFNTKNNLESDKAFEKKCFNTGLVVDKLDELA